VPPEEESRRGARSRGAGILLLLVAALVLAAACRWTPLSEWLDLQTLKGWGATFRENRYALLLVLTAYLLGGLVMMPVTLLILVTALTFAPVEAFLYALAGSLLSALSTFGLGRLLGRETVRRLAGARLNRLSRWLGRRGLVAVTAVRLFPVAPFTVVNMVAGASHIRFRDFSLGTLLGMAPGVLAITVFERSLEQAVVEPAAGNFLLLGAVLVAVVGLAWGGRRWLSRMKPPEEGGKGGVGD
ncbi:MAG TPA: TVP38/TMEM64 family protein, partial [Desulfuromonadales bacterium]